MSRIDDVLSKVLEDLPFCDNIRVVCGPHASKDSLRPATIFPSRAIASLEELAYEILSRNGQKPVKPLTSLDRIDVLQVLSKFKTISPFLRDRSVCKKISEFITSFNDFFTDQTTRDAALDFIQSQNEDSANVLKAVCNLWDSGQIENWSGGSLIRSAVELLREADLSWRPRRVFLWGFGLNLNPLEEAFVHALDASRIELESVHPTLRFWRPHSFFDELAFVRDEIQNLRQQNVAWKDIGVFMANESDQSLVVDAFLNWNFPIGGAGYRRSVGENADAIFWLGFLRAMAGGLETNAVLALFSAGDARAKVIEEWVYAKGIVGSAQEWRRCPGKFPEIEFLLNGLKLFSRSMKPESFYRALLEFAQNVREWRSPDLLMEFAESLLSPRPYLALFSMRLPRYLVLFEEFLKNQSRREVLKSPDGIEFGLAGKWIPQKLKHAFILGIDGIDIKNPPDNPFQTGEVSAVWSGLNGDDYYKQWRCSQKQALLSALLQHESVVMSAPQYGSDGSEKPESAWVKELRGETPFEKEGGSHIAGWGYDEVELNPHREFNAVRSEPVTSLRVSEFEEFLKCPFRHYARDILKLEPTKKVGVELDALARGSLLHRIFEVYIRDELDGHLVFDPKLWREQFDERIQTAIRERGLPGLARTKALEKKTKRSFQFLFERWLDWEIENREAGLVPVAVEESFQFKLFDGTPQEVELRGKIDRVSRLENTAVVLDYKTGEPPFRGGELVQGTGVQLLAYGHAVEKQRKLEIGAAHYVSIGKKIQQTSGVFIHDFKGKVHRADSRNSGLVKESFASIFSGVLPHWKDAVQRLQAGQFEARPYDSKICRTCSYKGICGYADASNEGPA